MQSTVTCKGRGRELPVAECGRTTQLRLFRATGSGSVFSHVVLSSTNSKLFTAVRSIVQNVYGVHFCCGANGVLTPRRRTNLWTEYGGWNTQPVFCPKGSFFSFSRGVLPSGHVAWSVNCVRRYHRCVKDWRMKDGEMTQAWNESMGRWLSQRSVCTVE